MGSPTSQHGAHKDASGKCSGCFGHCHSCCFTVAVVGLRFAVAGIVAIAGATVLAPLLLILLSHHCFAHVHAA